jgi:hypothetical protein
MSFAPQVNYKAARKQPLLLVEFEYGQRIVNCNGLKLECGKVPTYTDYAWQIQIAQYAIDQCCALAAPHLKNQHNHYHDVGSNGVATDMYSNVYTSNCHAQPLYEMN